MNEKVDKKSSKGVKCSGNGKTKCVQVRAPRKMTLRALSRVAKYTENAGNAGYAVAASAVYGSSWNQCILDYAWWHIDAIDAWRLYKLEEPEQPDDEQAQKDLEVFTNPDNWTIKDFVRTRTFPPPSQWYTLWSQFKAWFERMSQEAQVLMKRFEKLIKWGQWAIKAITILKDQLETDCFEKFLIELIRLNQTKVFLDE